MNMKKTLKSKKGFTLVEILVVLVILAIIAAFTIPAMLGFVEDSKSKAKVAEARAAYVAAQMVVTEAKAANPAETQANLALAVSAADGTQTARMSTLLATDAPGKVVVEVDAAGKVSKTTYTSTDGYILVLVPGQSVVITKP